MTWNVYKNSLVASLLILPMLFSLQAAASQVYSSDGNLLPNSSFESSWDGLSPNDWWADSWGSLDAHFAYSSEAYTGTKSLKTTISHYEDGDAKWLTSPVSVQAGRQYTYADWYRSDVETYVWAQFIDSNNNPSYHFLGRAGLAEQWSKTSFTFMVPQDVVSVSMYHVLASNGSLWLDDVSLSRVAPCQPAVAGQVLNGDFEEVCDATWQYNGWEPVQYGTGSASFGAETGVSPRTGVGSATFVNVDDGAEVGYQTTVLNPESNRRYSLSFWHADTTYVYAYVAFTLGDGSVIYRGLMSAPATLNDWSLYVDSFTTPTDTREMAIVIATSGVGTVAIDDVSLILQPVVATPHFSAPLVSITFDDGTSGAYTSAVGAMATHQYKGTFYLNADLLNRTGYMKSSEVAVLANSGHEIGSHLYHHSDVAQIDNETLRSELQGNKIVLQSIIGSSHPIASFATPYGSYTSGKIDVAMDYVASHRTTDGSLNTKDNFNPRQIHGRLVTASTTIAEFESWLNEAKQSQAWLVLVYHNVTNSNQGQGPAVAAYNVTPSNFALQMAALQQSGLAVETVESALNILSSQ